LKIEEIYGYSNAEETHIAYLALMIYFYDAYEEVFLKNCFVKVEYENISFIKFDESLISSNIPVFNNFIISNLSNSSYGVICTFDSDNSIINRFGLTFGDKAIILINLNSIIRRGGLPVGNSLSGEFIINNSSKIQYNFTVKNDLDNRVIKLL